MHAATYRVLVEIQYIWCIQGYCIYPTGLCSIARQAPFPSRQSPVTQLVGSVLPMPNAIPRGVPDARTRVLCRAGTVLCNATKSQHTRAKDWSGIRLGCYPAGRFTHHTIPPLLTCTTSPHHVRKTCDHQSANMAARMPDPISESGAVYKVQTRYAGMRLLIWPFILFQASPPDHRRSSAL